MPASIAQPVCRRRKPLRRLRSVRLPTPVRIDPRPSAPTERVPVDLAGVALDRPDRIELPVGSSLQTPTPDVKQPPGLPILARPSTDRAPLEDPTADWTAASIITVKLPLRSTQAPFVKVGLPDPFENVEAAKVKTAVAEDPLRALGNPPPPKP